MQSERPVDEGCLEIATGSGTVSVRVPQGSLAYSLSTVAWRLAQELLVGYERPRRAAGRHRHRNDRPRRSTRRDPRADGPALRRPEPRDRLSTRWSGLCGSPVSSTRIHRIRPDDVRDAPPLGEVLPNFLEYIALCRSSDTTSPIRRAVYRSGGGAPFGPRLWQPAHRYAGDRRPPLRGRQ